MIQLQNDRYLRALQKQPVDRTPIWLMRQAGRYLPEYRAIRAQAGDFMSLCKNHELACEVTLQPLRRFDLDAAILFSDILTIPDAMGLGLHFIQGEGPKFSRPIKTNSDIAKLAAPDPTHELQYVLNSVSTIKKALNGSVPLIGFSGSPWTLACYMVEGGASKTFSKIKALTYSEPKIAHQLLKVLRDSITSYLNAQIEAGAQALMIFDTWGGILTTPAYKEFSLQYMAEIIDQLTKTSNGRKVPVTLFTKNGSQWLEDLAETGADALSLDWTCELGIARSRVGKKVALQGNLDPAFLYSQPNQIKQEVARILASYGAGSGHVFNLGHGITPDVNPENVSVFINAAHKLSGVYHK